MYVKPPDMCQAGPHPSPANVSSSRVPPSGLACRDALPPCNSACCATSARPSPDPEREAVDPREKRSKTAVRSSSGIPVPLSSMAISTPSLELVRLSRISVALPCLTALAMALSITSRRPVGNPTISTVGDGTSDTCRPG